MKKRKSIQDVFAYNDVESKLETAEITDITEYEVDINDINIFYTYDETNYQISLTDGDLYLTPPEL